MNKNILLLFMTIMLGGLIHFEAKAQNQLWGSVPYGGNNDLGLLFSMNADGSGFIIKNHFLTSGVGPPNYTTLSEYNGEYYGVTPQGGTVNNGVIFSFNPTDNSYTKRAEFLSSSTGNSPTGKLVLGPNNKFYGMTSKGGADGKGTFFEYDPATDGLVKLLDLNSTVGYISQGNLTLASNSKIYGVLGTGGPGAVGGILFEYDVINAQFATKYDFSSNQPAGSGPVGSLIEGSGGLLYGATNAGGVNSAGVVFTYNINTSDYTQKASFAFGNNMQGYGFSATADGKFFFVAPSNSGATGNGSIVQFNSADNQITVLYSFTAGTGGAYPYGDLLAVGSKLYGTCYGQLTASSSLLFEYDLTNNVYTVKKTLTADDGYRPFSGLLQASNGKLYGLTSEGGTYNNGVLFEYDLSSLVYTKKYIFDAFAPQGARPRGTMTLAPNGKLYGVTSEGGTTNDGVVYEYDPTLDNFAVKSSLAYATTGSKPYGTLALASNGKLYGTTTAGGPNGWGTLFEYDPVGNTLTKKHDFLNSTTGSTPYAGLTAHPNGKLYGTTVYGGSPTFSGVLFEFDPATGTVIGKLNLTTGNGNYDYGKMLLHTDGKLYGTTSAGGSGSVGAIFEYDADINQYTKKIDLATTNGAQIYGGLTSTGDGKLYGLASYGGSAFGGVLFEYLPATNGYTVKFEFATLSEGLTPRSTMARSSNGKLYGLTTFGGSNNNGVIFEYDQVGNTYTKKTDLVQTNGWNADYTGILALPVQQTIAFNSLPTVSYSNQTFTLPSITDAGLPITYTSSNMSVATVSGNTVTLTGTGTTTITASQAGGSLFAPAATVGQTLNVIKGNQTITFNTISAKTYGDAAFDLPISVDSSLPLNITSSDPSVATVSGTTVTIVGSGTATITASQPGNTLFNAATNQMQTLAVGKKAQAISFASLPEKQTSDAPFNLSATATSGLAVTFSTSNTAVATISGNTLTIQGPGSTSIFADQTGNNNYLPATQATVNLVVKSSQTITFNTLPSKKLNDLPFTLNATSTSGLTVTYSSSNQAVAQVSGNTVTIITRGSTDIQASQPGDGNYHSATPVIQTLTVINTAPTVTNAITEQTALLLTPFTFTFSNNVFADADGDALTYSATKYDGSNLPMWLTFNAMTRTFSGTPTANDTTATLRLTADDGFSGTVNTLFKIRVKIAQTITFSVLTSKKLNDAPFTLNATASSTLAVTYTSSNPAVASISGSTVTIHARGSTDIQASQGGNDSYGVAVSVTQTLTIVNTAPTVANAIAEQEALQLTPFTFTFADNVFADADGDALTYTVTKYDGSNLPTWLTLNATARTFSGTPTVNDTTATIRLTANDGFNGTMNTLFKIRIKIITGVEPDASAQIKIYPNPVHHTLIIENEAGEVFPVIIRSTLGEVVYQNGQRKQHEVNVLPWAAGLYIVEVRKADVVTQTKIIKN